MASETTDSPCIKVCVVDLETGFCIGCGRSRTEIAEWLRLTDTQRQDVVSELPGRLSDMTRHRRRKGGRRTRRSELDKC
ncbi:MAG: DUF1289 domain-containing protein [Hyphomicrobiales bacterium]